MKKTITKFRAEFSNGGYTESDTLEKLQAELKLFNLDYEPKIIQVTEDLPDLRPRKYLCNDSYEDPKDKDIKILPLFSQEIRENGKIIINHWLNYDLQTFTFSNLAISETLESFFDENQDLKYQKNTIRFYKKSFSNDIESFFDEKIIINTKDFVR